MRAVISLVISLACLLLLLPVVTVTAAEARPCNDGLGNPNKGKNFILNLSSSDDNIRLSRQVFRKTGLDEVTINVGGADKVLRPKDMVTAAEFIAAKQVLLDGSQSIVIDGSGIATGGNFTVNEIIKPGHLSSMVIPADVIGIWSADKPIYNITRVLQLLPEGMLVGVTGKKDTLAIRMGTLDVGSLAKLTTTVTPELAAMVSDLAGNVNQTLDLKLFTHCACTNAGEISASGNLLIDTKTSIVNSGLISSLNGSVTLTGVPGRDLLIDNVSGTISALNGDINFRLPKFMASSSLDVVGGVLEALNINVNGGNGPATLLVDEIIGTVQGRAGSATVTTAEGTLDVGSFLATRGGITLTGGENVAINSADNPSHLITTTRVGDVQITAMTGDITLGNSTEISATGGSIIALASSDLLGGTGITLTAEAVDPPKNGHDLTGGGIHLGAGLTSSNELSTLLAGQPAPFATNPNPLPSIGLSVNNTGTGLVRVTPADGTGITLNGSVANIDGGVLLLQAETGSTINMTGATLNTFLPVSYREETSATATRDEFIVDTGEDDPGVLDDEFVASK